jgi:hypothetical protein
VNSLIRGIIFCQTLFILRQKKKLILLNIDISRCSGLENHFHFSYNEVAIDVYLSREGKGKYHENLGLGSGVGYARGRY